MNATEAKKLLETVPHNQFIEGLFTNGENKCCAIGHLVRLKSENPENYSSENCNGNYGMEWANEATEFGFRTTAKFINEKHNISAGLNDVNNSSNINGYNQHNPKDRVMACLNDMIEEGY